MSNTVKVSEKMQKLVDILFDHRAYGIPKEYGDAYLDLLREIATLEALRDIAIRHQVLILEGSDTEGLSMTDNAFLDAMEPHSPTFSVGADPSAATSLPQTLEAEHTITAEDKARKLLARMGITVWATTGNLLELANLFAENSRLLTALEEKERDYTESLAVITHLEERVTEWHGECERLTAASVLQKEELERLYRQGCYPRPSIEGGQTSPIPTSGA